MDHVLLFTHEDSDFSNDFHYFKNHLSSDLFERLKPQELNAAATMREKEIPSVLILDDSPNDLIDAYEALCEGFRCYLYRIDCSGQGVEAIKLIKPWIYVADMALTNSANSANPSKADWSGIRILQETQKQNELQRIPSIIFTKHNWQEAMKENIDKLFYVNKHGTNWKFNLQRYAEEGALFSVSQIYPQELDHRSKLNDLRKIYFTENSSPAFTSEIIKGDSIALRTALKNLDKITRSNRPVLILGETGTGKGLVAKAIHDNCERKGGPFVSYNCATLTENLFQSEMFGVIPNYPGFHNPEGKKGIFESADKGTLFLDEIGFLSREIQGMFLRAVEEGEIEPLGGTPKKVDVRLISATDINIDDKEFAPDFQPTLFQRIAKHKIHLPALRERKEDIKILADYFISEFSKKRGINNVISYEYTFLEALQSYGWPRNIRELRDEIENAVEYTICDNANNITLKYDILPDRIKGIIQADNNFGYLATKLRSFLSLELDENFWNGWEQSVDQLNQNYRIDFEPERIKKNEYKEKINNLINSLSEESIHIKFDKIIKNGKDGYFIDAMRFRINTKKLNNNFIMDLFGQNTSISEISVIDLWTKIIEKKYKLKFNDTIGQFGPTIKRGLICIAIISMNIPTLSSLDLLRYFFSLDRIRDKVEGNALKTKIIIDSFGDKNPRNFYSSLKEKEWIDDFNYFWEIVNYDYA